MAGQVLPSGEASLTSINSKSPPYSDIAVSIPATKSRSQAELLKQTITMEYLAAMLDSKFYS
jgi:hypothetical protein